MEQRVPNIMNDSVSQKIGMGFAFGAFGFLLFLSLLAGATFLTSVVRGVQGALLFGGLAWWLGWFLLKDVTDGLEEIQEMENPLEKTKSEKK